MTVVIEPAAAHQSAVLRVTGQGFLGQGATERVPREGYDAWKEGALRGARYALRTAALEADVLITQIAGLTTDTNASIVALATARAVWASQPVEVRPEDVERLETVAFSSWRAAAPQLPTLD